MRERKKKKKKKTKESGRSNQEKKKNKNPFDAKYAAENIMPFFLSCIYLYVFMCVEFVTRDQKWKLGENRFFLLLFVFLYGVF